jgi:hypothetical protein
MQIRKEILLGESALVKRSSRGDGPAISAWQVPIREVIDILTTEGFVLFLASMLTVWAHSIMQPGILLSCLPGRMFRYNSDPIILNT